MPTLIACLSSGKGTWNDVFTIMKDQQWDKIFLITNRFGQENFKGSIKNVEFILIDTFNEDITLLKNAIVKQLQGKIKDFEIALNFVSGSGREHMALAEAVLELGLNFRLIIAHQGSVQTLGLAP